ncbi:MAG: penicillin-binding protein activator [Pseudomonadota bacterium]
MFAVFASLRKTLNRLVVFYVLIALAACQTTTVGTGQSIDAAAPVPVALLVPHGAQGINEQKLARDLENAARLAVSDLVGVEVDLRVYPTAGSTANAQSSALQAVEDGAKIIVGPLRGEAANAVSLAMAPKNINVLAFSNNASIAGGNLFVLGQTFEDTANRLMGFAANQGKRTVLTVHSRNLAGTTGRDAILQAVANNGLNSAGTVSYDFTQDGVINAIPAIKSAAESNQADTIFLTANAAGALPLFSQLLPENGLTSDVTQLVGLSRWDTPPQTLDLPGVQGGWFALPDPQRTAQFESRFGAAFGERPHPLAGLSYDAIAAIGALAQSGDPDALSRGSFTQGAGFQGVNGIFRFNQRGTTERGLAVATIDAKQVVVLSPAPRSFDSAGF